MTALSARARHNALKRYRPADDPDLIAARRALEAARTDAHIQRLVDAAPPLTGEQRNRLATLLRPGQSGGAAA